MIESAVSHFGFIRDSDTPIIAGDMVMMNSIGFSDMEKLSGIINLGDWVNLTPRLLWNIL